MTEGKTRRGGVMPPATTPKPDIDIKGQSGSAWAMPAKLSDAALADAALSYRHDFGLLSEEEQGRVIFEAKEWYHALYKTVCEPVKGMRIEG